LGNWKCNGKEAKGRCSEEERKRECKKRVESEEERM